MDINKRVLLLIKLSKEAKTDEERLAFWADINDLLSIKVQLMDKVLNEMQKTLHHVATEYMPDSNKKEQILNFDFHDHINDSGTSNEPLFKNN